MHFQPTPPPAPETLTVNEVAELLRVHPETVRRRLVHGEIYGIRLGTAWRIPRQEVERLLNGRPSLTKETIDDAEIIAYAARNF